MRLVENDLILSERFQDKYEAISAIKEFLSVIVELKTRYGLKKLLSDRDVFRELMLTDDYHFDRLFSEMDCDLSRNDKSLLRTIRTSWEKIDVSENSWFITECGTSSKLCSWAYSNNAIMISIPMNDYLSKSSLNGRIDGDNSVSLSPVSIKNIAKMEHISRDRFLPGIRKYEFNPKHKVNVGWGSEMPLSDEDAQKLLNIALPIDGDQERHLVAAYKGKYYCFENIMGTVIMVI